MQIDDQHELNELTSKLIASQSISPDQAGSLDYIATYLEAMGFTITWLNRGSTSNIIATIGSGVPIVAFAGHVDVVPPGDTREWKYDPFTLNAEDGKLYGRGIADMKGAVAAFIVAAKQCLTKNATFTLDRCGTIMLLLTSDEEAAATDGTTVLVEYLKIQNIRIPYCILGEPSSAKVLGDTIRVGRRGSLTGHLEILGKQGHVAYPKRCDNPIHTFTPALQQLLTTTWDNGTALFPPTTMQITNINAGLGVDNVTPAKLNVRLNFRFNDLHSSDALNAKVVAILDEHDLRYNAKWINGAKPFCSKIGRLTAIVHDVIHEHSGIAVVNDTGGGTSDGRFLIDVCDEIVELGMLNDSIHQINEWIPEGDLLALANIYQAILEKLFV